MRQDFYKPLEYFGAKNLFLEDYNKLKNWCLKFPGILIEDDIDNIFLDVDDNFILNTFHMKH